MNPTLITKKELLKELDISTGVLAELEMACQEREKCLILIKLLSGEKIGLKTY